MSLKSKFAVVLQRLSSVSLAFLAAGVLLLTVANAQTSKGTIVGTVRDSTGAVVASAKVTATNEQTSESRDTMSNSDGAFRIDAISNGSYAIHVEAPGFETTNLKGLAVNPSVVTSYDVTLKVGATSTTVQVQALTSTINTENGELSGTIDSSELRNLPIFSLNPIELATTVPGVQVVNQVGFSNGQNIEVNGTRPRANSFLIDGADINDTTINGQAVQPNIPDMYASETVLTNAYSAEYGRGGGAVVNLITAGGTNKFHGTAWDLYTGSGLNAFDGQTRQFQPTSADKARFDQHQYGFTVGGPAIKDKLFGFGAMQLTRFYGKEQAGVITLPDAAGFATLQSINTPNSTLLQQVLGGGTYLNSFSSDANVDSTQAVNPADCPGGNPCNITFAHFTRPPPSEISPDTQWTYRVDYTPRQNDSFYFRYLHDRSSLTPDFFNNPDQLPGFDTTQGGPSELGSGAWTHVFSPRLLNELRVSETRIFFAFDIAPQTKANPLALLPSISIGGITGLAPLGAVSGDPQSRALDLYQFQDTVSFTRGRHTLRIGMDVAQQIEKDQVPFNSLGTLSFNKGAGFTALGNFLDNFLGPSGSASISAGTSRVDPHAFRQAYFAQDDFKLRSDLTMNLGLRYEYQHNPENALPFPALDPSNPFAPIDTVFKVHEAKLNFGPRLGVAYNPHGGSTFLNDGKTVYHAGYGLFYDILFTNIVQNSAETAPNVFSGTQTSTQGRGLPNAFGQIANIQPVLSPLSTDETVTNNLTNPRTHQWNLGFERQLPWNIKWTLNYVGSRGEKLFANQQYNFFSFDTGERLNPDRGAIIVRDNSADSIYHSLQTEVSHDFSHGFLVRGTWTYGKLLSDGDEVFSDAGVINTSYAADLAPGGRSHDWGNSIYDHRHYVSIVYVWAVPGLHSDNRAMDSVLSAATRHWTISGISQFQSGPYLTMNFVGLDSNGDGSASNDRPLIMNRKAAFDSVGIDAIYVDQNQPGTYYDLKTLNTTGVENVVDPSTVHWVVPFGSQYTTQGIGRNSYANPGLQFWNLALQKDLPLHLAKLENSAFQFRVEAQDVGNHNNVGPVDTNLLDVGTSTFTDKSSAREQDFRSLRLWAKFVF
jgi:hypothetical protein